MPTTTYYVFDGANNKYESMTKEQILAAIEQAVSTHEITDVDTGFVTKLKEQNKSAPLKFWVGTTAEYNAIANPDTNTFYILSDDTELEDLQTAINQLQTATTELRTDVNNIVNNYIATINETLGTIGDEIEGLQDDAQTIHDDLDTVINKNGDVLNSQTIASGNVNISLSGSYQIANYSVVKVLASGYEVLCSVTHNASTGNTLIRGTLLQDAQTIINVELHGNHTTNKITANYSMTVDIATRVGTDITVSTITGVC